MIKKYFSDLPGYCSFRAASFIIGAMPFKGLYALSNGLSYLLNRHIKYRKEVVISNLRNSFPKKSESELKHITSGIYSNLCDILLESFKGVYLNASTLKKRYQFANIELIENYFKNNSDLLIVGSHYTNWEWGTFALGHVFDYEVKALYKPLSNRLIDQYVRNTREKNNMELVSIRKTRSLFDKPMDKHPQMYIFLSDQSPSNTKEAIWVDFLNRKTACLHGVEKYAVQNNLPVLFSDIYRTRRGHYKIKFIQITDQPGQLPRGEITRRYMQLLEKRILQKPEDWLWTHRRWKYSPESHSGK